MNQVQSDLLKATAKSMRKAARGIDRLCALLAPDYYDGGTPSIVDMTAKELARALKNEEGRSVADILYFWLVLWK